MPEENLTIPDPPPWVKTEADRTLWESFWNKAFEDVKAEREEEQRKGRGHPIEEKLKGDSVWKKAEKVTRESGELFAQ